MKKTKEFRRHLRTRERREASHTKKVRTHFFVFKDEERGKGRRGQTDDDDDDDDDDDVTMIMRSGSKTE
jgi:hypothetical protein